MLTTLATWVGAIFAQFVQLLAGSAAAREAGKQEVTIANLKTDKDVKDRQIEIAAKPRPDSAALDQRMLDGDL